MALCTGPFFRRVAKRKQAGQDVKITISARDAETGVGKTTLALLLALYFHTAPTRWTTEWNATYDVPEFNARYDMLPPGSSLMLEEAEQLDARRSNQQTNVDTARTWETRRVDEITSILTLPSVAELDRRMERLHNFWINVTARGSCKIYAAHVHDFTHQVYYEGLQRFQWPSMDNVHLYQELVGMKEDFVGGASNTDWVKRHEIESQYEKQVEEKQREMRDRIISSVYSKTELSQRQVGEALPPGDELTQQQIGNIVNRGRV